MLQRKSLVVFSFSHMTVDFACFFVLMGGFYRDVADLGIISVGFLIYNFVAFALQVPIGYLADRSRVHVTWFAVTGCALIAVAVPVPGLPWVRLALCAFGNALFHIGGGVDSLVHAGGKFARSGIFIAFGAIGVTLGTLVGKNSWISAWVVAALLLVCVALLLVFCRADASKRAVFSMKPAMIGGDEAVIFICMASILIRAVVGAYTPAPWRTTVPLILLSTAAVFLGKFLGGILADRLAPGPVTVVSLLLSAPLLVFFSHNVLLCCLGLLLFNVTTAVTLCLIVAKLPDNPGLGFGLTTFALFVGTALSFFWVMPEPVRKPLILCLIVLSAACMFLAAPKIFVKKDSLRY